MITQRTRTIEIEVLRGLMMEMLHAVGCDEQIAETVADIHLEADLRGVSVQGFNHLVNSHLPEMHAGRIDPAGRPSVVREAETYALVDGHSGPGPIAALFAADLAAAKARQAGCCMVGVINSHDLFQAGLYVERIARQGLVGFVFSDDAVPVVHPLGGCQPLIGSNPMAIAIPTEGEPFLHDFAPVSTLPTYVRYAKRYGSMLPETVAVDCDGYPTRNPHLVNDGAGYQQNKGAIDPSGAKMYGLLLAIDFLAGALPGCDMGVDHVTKSDARKGHLFLALDPSVFGSLDDFRHATSRRIEALKRSRKAPGVHGIRVPGERSFAQRAASLKSGRVQIDAELWRDAVKLCRRLSVATPQL